MSAEVSVQTIQMVDLVGQYRSIQDEIDDAIRSVLRSGRFIRGPEVGEFECQLAGSQSVRYALGVGNGTDAIQIALMALGVGPGDEVVTPSFTFVATAEAAALLGATPVFADIDAGTFNLDPDSVASVVTDRTKVIVPVHLFGQMADMERIHEIAAGRDIPVLEDAAQAIGARRGEARAGSTGAFGTLSFFPSKNLGAFGDGGAILTDDEHLYELVRMIANHGSRKKYFNEMVGLNSRLDTLQAAVLSVKLKHLDRFAEARCAAADRYDRLLADVPAVTVPFRDPANQHVFHQYTIRVEEGSGAKGDGRDGLVEHLRAASIPCAVYYPVALHDLPAYADAGRATDLSETEQAAREVLSLPMHTELTESQQERVVDAIKGFVSGSGTAR